MIQEKEEPLPEDIAAYNFQTALPEFILKVNSLTKNQAIRVLKALGEAPLNNDRFGFYDNKEIEVFNLGMKLQQSKFTLFQVALKAKKEETTINEAV